jgi:hypothetical protein
MSKHVFGTDKFQGDLILIKNLYTSLYKEICFNAFPTGYFKNKDITFILHSRKEHLFNEHYHLATLRFRQIDLFHIVPLKIVYNWQLDKCSAIQFELTITM